MCTVSEYNSVSQCVFVCSSEQAERLGANLHLGLIQHRSLAADNKHNTAEEDTQGALLWKHTCVYTEDRGCMSKTCMYMYLL